jgi:glycosyltransferase involved in cell wall biosynthesis
MGAQLPTVVAETGGLGEIVEHMESGVTTYPGDPKSLAWGLLQVLKNPELANKLRTNGYQRVLDTFNWPKIALQTAKVYERVVSEAKKKQTVRV